MTTSATETIDAVRSDALPLHGPEDFDPLLERTDAARCVLIGEASHGTSEFYRWRAELTRRLIAEQGFSFVAVEGDWPDCQDLHSCVIGAPGSPNDPMQVLWGFERWPRWMWANEEVAGFAGWLRDFNVTREAGAPVGFHGLDVYSLWDSLERVVEYLREHEPDKVDAALDAFRCFEPYGEDPQAYGVSTVGLVPQTCEREVVRLLAQLRADAAERGPGGLDPSFEAEQNAAVVAGAERYYREMMRGGSRSWNVRDTHMADTLDRLLRAYGPDAKGVVWAHNTHIGDARATDMAAAGMHNLGQLVRERHGRDKVVAVGFGTHHGTVIGAPRWGGPVQRLEVPDARRDSVEALMHRSAPGGDSLFLLPGRAQNRQSHWSREVRGHRAIGVVYDPRRGRFGGYVPTVLSSRYDAFVYCDRSSSLTPLHSVEVHGGEQEAYPTGQ